MNLKYTRYTWNKTFIAQSRKGLQFRILEKGTTV